MAAEERVTVSPELAALIHQLLSVEPEARGSARQVAEAAEHAARVAGPGADEAITARVARVLPVHRRWGRAVRWVSARSSWLVAAAAGLGLGLWVTPRVAQQGQRATQEAARAGAEEGSAVGLAEAEEVGQAGAAGPDEDRREIALEMPKEPLPGQFRAPCKAAYEDAIRGGCWVALLRKKPPCGKDTYEWEGACYLSGRPGRCVPRRSKVGAAQRVCERAGEPPVSQVPEICRGRTGLMTEGQLKVSARSPLSGE